MVGILLLVIAIIYLRFFLKWKIRYFMSFKEWWEDKHNKKW